jgi:phospholipase/carboxylesterase
MYNSSHHKTAVRRMMPMELSHGGGSSGQINPFEATADFESASGALCADLIAALEIFEESQRLFFPGIVPVLRERFGPLAERLERSMARLRSIPCLPETNRLRNDLLEASALCLDSLRLSVEVEYLEAFLANFRKAVRRVNRAMEILYPLHGSLPIINRFFLEKPLREKDVDFIGPVAPAGRTGLQHVGADQHPYARGSFSVFIPESYDESGPWPLVVALHGGFGHGRDFIWTWLREARSRRFLLVAPTSCGGTWSITGPDIDDEFLREVLRNITDRWNVDKKRILLTGLSDGATYLLKRALDEESPFSAFALAAGILPPFNLRHVRGRRILWVHGARDWMFPLWYAKTGYKMLREAGADITQEIVPDLYHAYPREKNDSILNWFDPALALPAP